MGKLYITPDTPLSVLFRRPFHEELRQVINSWRIYLIDCPKDADELLLNRFTFNRDVQAKQIYMALIDLIEKGALKTSLHKLAAYLFSHANLSSSERTLYNLLCRYKNEWETTSLGINNTPAPPVIA